MAKSNPGKFKKTEDKLFSGGKGGLKKGKSAVTAVGKRGKKAIGRRKK